MTLIIRVETWGDGEEPERVDYFDLHDHHGRAWMAKHSWWAMHNDREVVTFAAPAEEAEEARLRRLAEGATRKEVQQR